MNYLTQYCLHHFLAACRRDKYESGKRIFWIEKSVTGLFEKSQEEQLRDEAGIDADADAFNLNHADSDSDMDRMATHSDDEDGSDCDSDESGSEDQPKAKKTRGKGKPSTKGKPSKAKNPKRNGSSDDLQREFAAEARMHFKHLRVSVTVDAPRILISLAGRPWRTAPPPSPRS